MRLFFSPPTLAVEAADTANAAIPYDHTVIFCNELNACSISRMKHALFVLQKCYVNDLDQGFVTLGHHASPYS